MYMLVFSAVIKDVESPVNRIGPQVISSCLRPVVDNVASGADASGSVFGKSSGGVWTCPRKLSAKFQVFCSGNCSVVDTFQKRQQPSAPELLEID